MISLKEFQQLELRIAQVVDVKPHPKADRLYILKINVGDKEKQIVAGIRPSYGSEELVGKKIVVVNNLEPAIIRGVESQAMLLAASEGEKIVLLTSDRDISSGAFVR